MNIILIEYTVGDCDLSSFSHSFTENIFGKENKQNVKTNEFVSPKKKHKQKCSIKMEIHKSA